MRVGLFGGTFDPIHNGHLTLANEVRIKFNLDEIWFIPAGNPYFKTNVSSVSARCTMIEKAIESLEWAHISVYEAKQNGPSYTANTVKYYKEQYPEIDFYLIMGADSLNEIEKWYNYQYILNNCSIIVVERQLSEIEKFKEYLKLRYNAIIYYLPFNINLSSTEIRNKVKHGESYRFLVPNKVYKYINNNYLYKGEN